MLRQKLWIVFVLAAFMLVAAACPPAEEPPIAPVEPVDPAPVVEDPVVEPRGVLRFATNAADLGNLDPHFATTTQDRSVVDMVFNGLIRYRPGDGSVFEADLAVELPEPELVDGQQVWTFQLREGVMCHPVGDEVPAYELTSEDVVYSLQKSANPDTSAFAGEYVGMAVEADGPYTVVITMEQPLSPVLFFPKVADYAGGFIVCKEAYEALGEDRIMTHPVGTGPFRFESYSPGERVMLAAHEDYFRGTPQLEAVDFRYMADISSRELGLRARELDAINGQPDEAWIASMEMVLDAEVDVFGVGEVVKVLFNLSAEPIDDIRVRQAIAYALDQDEFMALFGERVGEKVYSAAPYQFLDGGLTREDVEEAGFDYVLERDLDRARELLAEAGYEDGLTLEVVTSEMAGYRVTYESMQAQLAEAGIDMQIEVVDHSSMHSLIRQNVNPIVVYISWRPNNDVYLTRFFHSDSIIEVGASPDTNFTHYGEIDDLIVEARFESDPDRQIQLWKEANLQLLEDVVIMPLLYQNQVYARSVNVDYGHELISSLALYPQITENTRLLD